MDPASRIIRSLGGPTKVAKRLGVHRTRVSNWSRAKQKGGTGGRIPMNHHRGLLLFAAELGVELSAEDLLPPEEDSLVQAA